MIRHLAAVAAICLAPLTPAAASDPDALLDALALEDMIAVIRLEGIDYANVLAGGTLPSGGGQGWNSTVRRIYDAERMEATVRAGFAAEIGTTDLTPLIDFFTSEEGQEIIALELSAREAMLDETIEAEAREAANLPPAEGQSAKRSLIEAFIETNNLVDANVVGAMNSNYAFYMGMAGAGTPAIEMSEEEILADVWSQEQEIRDDTGEWLRAYLGLAYAPLANEVLADYVDISGTRAGQAMNRAVFAGFDRMFTDISGALGVALSRHLSQQEL